MPEICIRYGWYVSELCLMYVWDITKIYLICARDMPVLCLIYDWYKLDKCPRFARDLHEIYLRFAVDLSDDCLLIVSGVLRKAGTISGIPENCLRYNWGIPEISLKLSRVPSGVCIYIPGYVYIPFPEIGYVKGMYLIKKVCKTVFTAMFPD